MSVNNYSRIERHIREAQLQRSVEIAEAIADGLIWMHRTLQGLVAKVRGVQPIIKAQAAAPRV
jgi:hypothetical protein